MLVWCRNHGDLESPMTSHHRRHLQPRAPSQIKFERRMSDDDAYGQPVFFLLPTGQRALGHGRNFQRSQSPAKSRRVCGPPTASKSSFRFNFSLNLGLLVVDVCVTTISGDRGSLTRPTAWQIDSREDCPRLSRRPLALCPRLPFPFPYHGHPLSLQIGST